MPWLDSRSMKSVTVAPSSLSTLIISVSAATRPAVSRLRSSKRNA